MPTTDAEARRAVSEDLDRTIFLEAGAGSGKTSCLVARFVALVKDKGIPADRIAAITFTEKAAGELVHRIREQLSKEKPEALPLLDRAAIGTLHAFAQRILSQHPIEAGLPPRVVVLDEIASQVAFEARWEAQLDRMLDDPELELPLRLLFATEAGLDHLRDVAMAFDDNWDLVKERSTLVSPSLTGIDVEPILAKLVQVLAYADHCTSVDDRLLLHLQNKVTTLHRAMADAIDDDTRLSLLATTVGSKLGQKGNWTSIGKDVVVDLLAEIDGYCEVLRLQVQDTVLEVLASCLARFTVDTARERQRAGELEFHDLLVLARSLLNDPTHGAEVRAALAARYQRLLLDEFQDTDPIQLELATLIGTEPGSLFFVGDPKQSIYRFRRADIGTFLRARDELVGESEALTRNFRTGEPIVRWVNDTFGTLIVEAPDSQPAYLPLDAERPAPPVGPPVAFTGVDEHPAAWRAGDLREAEATDVAGAVCQAMADGWSVGEGGPKTTTWRAPRWNDIAILLPARTSLPFLERALEAANVPYRAETSSLVYGTREVRDLLMIARAVEDPTDALAVVATLRTPAFACGDDDLFTWRKRHGGRWDYQARLPVEAPADRGIL